MIRKKGIVVVWIIHLSNVTQSSLHPLCHLCVVETELFWCCQLLMGYCWYCINYVYWSDVSPRCWTIVASFYIERRKIMSLRKWTIASVRKKYSLRSKNSEHVLSNSHCCLNFYQDETVANAGIFPLWTYLVLMMKKGISYSSSSLLCLYLWRVRKSNFSSCPLPPASPSTGKPFFFSVQPHYWVGKTYFQVLARPENSDMVEFTPTS